MSEKNEVIELKAQAYDIIAAMEGHQLEIKKLSEMLQQTNQKIAEAMKPAQPE